MHNNSEHSTIQAEHTLAPDTKPPIQQSIFHEYFELIAETLIYVFFIMTFLLQSFVIPTGSMEDTLMIGDHLMVDKVAYSRSLTSIDHLVFPQMTLKRGMIVTFKAPPDIEKEYVKRVIGLPGETISIHDKHVFINGALIAEPYVYFNDPRTESGIRDNYPDYKIPANSYFCMGDNRDNSYDSRFWGTVPADNIIGKPWRIYWSYTSTSSDYRATGLGKIKDLFTTLFNFFAKTRWDRTSKRIS